MDEARQQQQALPSVRQPRACLLAVLLAGVQLAQQMAGNSRSCSSEVVLEVVLWVGKVLLQQQRQQRWTLGLLSAEQR
jgi:hypothetical protein